jgi:hypothetical protein
LKSTAAGVAACAAPAWLRATAAEAAYARVLDRLGVALYTVRDQMKADTPGTLKRIAELGYRYVESGLLSHCAGMPDPRRPHVDVPSRIP